MSAPSGAWGGVLLLLAGVWLLLQTLVAGLPDYIIGLASKRGSSSTSSGAPASSSPAPAPAKVSIPRQITQGGPG